VAVKCDRRACSKRILATFGVPDTSTFVYGPLWCATRALTGFRYPVRYMGLVCSTCGMPGHSKLPPAFPQPEPVDLDVGRGVILCALCELPLADHPSVTVHADLSELSLRRMRSPGVPWADQPGHAVG
jgi:hypothetical protein